MVAALLHQARPAFNPQQPALQSLSAIRCDNGAGIVTWLRSGPGPELALPAQLLVSADGSAYTSLGTMRRIDGGWRLAGADLPLQQTFYLRTQGRTTQVQSGATGNGLVRSTWEYHLSDNEGIFIDGVDGGRSLPTFDCRALINPRDCSHDYTAWSMCCLVHCKAWVFRFHVYGDNSKIDELGAARSGGGRNLDGERIV